MSSVDVMVESGWDWERTVTGCIWMKSAPSFYKLFLRSYSLVPGQRFCTAISLSAWIICVSSLYWSRENHNAWWVFEQLVLEKITMKSCLSISIFELRLRPFFIKALHRGWLAKEVACLWTGWPHCHNSLSPLMLEHASTSVGQNTPGLISKEETSIPALLRDK